MYLCMYVCMHSKAPLFHNGAIESECWPRVPVTSLLHTQYRTHSHIHILTQRHTHITNAIALVGAPLLYALHINQFYMCGV